MTYNPANTHTHTHMHTHKYLRLGERGKRKNETSLFSVAALEEWDKE